MERMRQSHRTFTEREALSALWEAGYEVSAREDPRFVVARKADARHAPQWRLDTQTLANDRLFERLSLGVWDGRNLDAELERLDAENGQSHVFCPVDDRFTTSPDGSWQLAAPEIRIVLPGAIHRALDSLAPLLLDKWHAAGDEPWTAGQIAQALGELGWGQASERGAWQFVRTWLQDVVEVRRVGQDYWMPARGIPSCPAARTLRIRPVLTQDGDEGPAAPDVETRMDATPAKTPIVGPEDDVLAGISVERVLPEQATWTMPLRTTHVVNGFLPVPAAARGVYPAKTPGEGDQTVLRGIWFETGDRFWLWLDRAVHRLYGPQLADFLAWCETATRLQTQWMPGILTFRVVGHDAAVQHEETRLVDVEELAKLRGGLGESYRQSIQTILEGTPEGLPFAELVRAVRTRQMHEVHRGTIRALLHTGGFIQRNGQWLPTPDSHMGARRLRRSLLQSAMSPEQSQQITQTATPEERLRRVARVIRDQLSKLMALVSDIPSR
ncbi:MAG: hypothetical protein HY331_06400 [Chloroflexi bacterium]|nr:hypothetical protein [Chloroflexota bacterium]